MTITRLAQFTGETRVITDISYFANVPTVGTTQAKTGTYSYPRNLNKGPFGKRLVAPSSAIRLGFWMYLASTTFANTCILYYAGHGHGYASTNNYILMELHSDTGEIIVKRNNSNVANANDILETISLPSQFGTTGTWFHVGITHKVDETDGFLSLYIDGNRVLNLVGDTRPSHWLSGVVYQTTVANVLVNGAGGTSGAQGFAGSSDATAGCFVDDFFIDSYVDEVDGPVPARRFLMVMPNGAGVDDDWTPDSGANYTMVDDNPNDGDVTKNKALATALRDTYTYGNIVVPADHRIVAVLPSPFAKRLDSEVPNGISVHAWDGVQYEDSADLDLLMSYDIPVFYRFETQPDGSDWDETDFNAMQFGVRSRGSF